MSGVQVERAARSADEDTATRVHTLEVPGRHAAALHVAGLHRPGAGADTHAAPREEHVTPPLAVPGSSLLVAHDPYGRHSETLRALRTELLLRHESVERANALVLLSPSGGEGRSQLAAELATSFAQLGHRTLLVDCDLRRPRLHALFGVANHAGLTQALDEDEPPLLNPVKGLPSLFLLAAGGVPPNPLELLSGGRFESLVERWRDEFQFAVFDTPPLSQCADALAVATVVGRVLALGRAGHTRCRDMREMLRRVATTQAQVVGAVLNHF
ncbi:MAG: CpsD/CapB family tyrosine-protein kinase [Nevskia sp.]|nr:CpsD/CapB family tyrosine-protein kinase [Nevskia sp.]